MANYELRVFLKGEKEPVLLYLDSISYVRVVAYSLFALPENVVEHLDLIDHSGSCLELGPHYELWRTKEPFGIIAIPKDKNGERGAQKTS